MEMWRHGSCSVRHHLLDAQANARAAAPKYPVPLSIRFVLALLAPALASSVGPVGAIGEPIEGPETAPELRVLTQLVMDPAAVQETPADDAEPKVALESAPRPSAPSASVSVGLPFRGRLRNARLIEGSALIRFKAGTPERERFGTDELVALIEGAARHVATVAPGAALTVGDLSRQRGGRMAPHRSHNNGRDADLLFYALDEQGKVAQPDRLVGFRGDGRGRAGDGKRYRFDDARNWALLEYLLKSPIAEVEHIFISNELRRRLLTEGRRRGADEALLERAARVLRYGGGRHHDHFHMRIRCAADDLPACRDAWARPGPPEHG